MCIVKQDADIKKATTIKIARIYEVLDFVKNSAFAFWAKLKVGIIGKTLKNEFIYIFF